MSKTSWKNWYFGWSVSSMPPEPQLIRSISGSILAAWMSPQVIASTGLFVVTAPAATRTSRSWMTPCSSACTCRTKNAPSSLTSTSRPP